MGTLVCKKLQLQYNCQETWFEIKEMDLNLKFKLNQTSISLKLPNYIVSYCLNVVAATVP
jgi:hypothetical protein